MSEAARGATQAPFNHPARRSGDLANEGPAMASRAIPIDVENIHGKAAGKRVLEPQALPCSRIDDGASTSGAWIEEDETQGPAAGLDDKYSGGVRGDVKRVKQDGDSNALRARASLPSTSYNGVREPLTPGAEKTHLEQEVLGLGTGVIHPTDHVYECQGQEDSNVRRLSVPDDETSTFPDPDALRTYPVADEIQDECDCDHEECSHFDDRRGVVFDSEWDLYEHEEQPCVIPRIHKRNRIMKVPNYIIELKSAMQLERRIVGGRRVVLVLFRAERNDGVEEVVDNLYMRVNRPAMLIDFYERNVNVEGFMERGRPPVSGDLEQPSRQEMQNATLPGGSGNQDPHRPGPSAPQVSKITQLIAAVSCTPIVTRDGRQDVLIRLRALTIDGQETVVDNIFMRKKYPFMLIAFYESKLQSARVKLVMDDIDWTATNM